MRHGEVSSPLSPIQPRASVPANMSSTPSTTLDSPLSSPNNIAKLLTLWFDQSQGLTEGLKKWFIPNPAVDAELAPWKPLVQAAREGELAAWSGSADGTLALLLLLDQLPRNVFRGTAEMFASDDQAVSVAVNAIARGVDRQVPLERQMFFYLPIMHQENLLAQVGCLGLYQGMAARAERGTEMHELLEGALGMCQVHVDIIRRFGRFPGRNKTLGRTSTNEELEFLKDKGPRGF